MLTRFLRVRRAELDASNESASETDDEVYDAEWQARLNAQIARSLGITESYVQPEAVVVAKEPHPGPQPVDEPEDDAVEEAEEFAFRMFSNARPAQKIVLEEDVSPAGDGTFTTKRPLSYYVVTALSDAQRHQYAVAAVSGEDVLARSKDRSWGLELPWKVTNIAITRKREPGPSGPTDKAAKKRRPGKKQRISLRRRARQKEAKQRAETQKVAEKEEHLKEKKKRLNRVKKLRKRAKNKEAKAAGNGGDGADSDGSE